jgi:hypothetical protein
VFWIVTYKQPWCSLPKEKPEKIWMNYISNHVNKPISRNYVWEIDGSCLRYEKKIGSGSVSDLWVLSFNIFDIFLNQYMLELLLDWHRYKGTYINKDVAIKVFKNGSLNENMQREFSQEIFITRFVLSQCSFLPPIPSPPLGHLPWINVVFNFHYTFGPLSYFNVLLWSLKSFKLF